MRIERHTMPNGRGQQVIVKASARDTNDWATRPGKSWPCSTLSGHRFVAVFDAGDLVDITVDGRDDRTGEITSDELNAFLTDHLGTYRPGDPVDDPTLNLELTDDLID